MIVLDLKCDTGHVFEAWFGSSGDFEEQKGRGLVECPICGSQKVGKALMAPAVGAKGNRKSDTPAKGNAPVPMQSGGEGSPAEMKALLSKLAEAQAKMLEKSDYVGKDFAREARAMHDGQQDERPIHGETTLDDAKKLVEDGVPVAPLPLPVRRREREN
ncbi:DUF1178 family protein [uncultured Parasphingopyxis sp.]|uniref:DUF1178 family protein n=1 Tax=uncultured Parasphingopyxis sp. TaxID=1547918 RepID=UPI002639448D|nr:DUF1178 family protein [uncultured Parasphingopyxis sp.]